MSTEASAEFVVTTRSNASEVLAKDAASARDFTRVIQDTQKSLDYLKAKEKSLVGSADEVVAARQKVKAEISSTRDTLGRLALAYDRASESEKAAEKVAAKAAEARKSGVRKAGERALQWVKGAITTAKQNAGSFVKAVTAEGRKMGEAADNAEKLAKGKSAGENSLASLLKWNLYLRAASTAAKYARAIVDAADGERTAQLQAEALLGSKASAEAAATWDRALVYRTGVAIETVRGYGDALARARLGGREYTTSLSAITMAQAATGDALASKVQELTTRYARMGVFTLGRFELDGTGLQTADVAAALAKSTNTSMAEAQKALVGGRLSIEKGAAAIRDAIDAKFGGVIAKKAISLPALMSKAAAKTGEFFAKINIDRLLFQIDKFIDRFDSTNPTGQQLIKVFQTVTNALEFILTDKMESFTDYLDLAALGVVKIENKILRTQVAWEKGIGPIGDIHRIVNAIADAVDRIGKGLKSADLSSLAGGMSSALTGALSKGDSGYVAAGKGAFEGFLQGFRDAGEIRSPSRRLERDAGRHLPAAIVGSLEKGRPAVRDASASLLDEVSAPLSRGMTAPSAPPSSPPAPVTVTVHFNGGNTDFASPEGRAAIARVIRDAVQG